MNPNSSLTSALGQVLQTFKPSRVNLVAGGILGLLLLVAGGVFIARAPHQEPKGVTFAYALGAACLTGGLVFFAFTLRLSYTRVDLCEAGFRHYSLAGIHDVTWDEVDMIQFHVRAEQNAGAHVDPSVTVHTEQGKTYHFTANHVTRMTAFVKVLGQLTSGYENLWEATSKVSERRWAVYIASVGLFTIVWAPMMFLDIAQAEQNAGEKPVRVNEVVYLLYQVGGKWLVVAGLLLLGLGLLVWGLVAHNKVKLSTPGHRKKNRSGHAAGREPNTGDVTTIAGERLNDDGTAS